MRTTAADGPRAPARVAEPVLTEARDGFRRCAGTGRKTDPKNPLEITSEYEL